MAPGVYKQARNPALKLSPEDSVVDVRGIALQDVVQNRERLFQILQRRRIAGLAIDHTDGPVHVNTPKLGADILRVERR